MNTHFDPIYLPYPSKRYPIYARGGMVNCSSPQAAAAGLKVLLRGGNAMDAAVAAAAALTVVEPTANGIGSDSFAIIWSMKDHELYGLNASGPAPREISAEEVLDRHLDIDGAMPVYGWTPVTVPGTPKAWAKIVERFGRLSLSEVLAPAADYAEEGYPCAPNLARMWQRAFNNYRSRGCTGGPFEEWYRTFVPDGHAYEAGEMIRLPYHAETLRAIGETDSAAFYTGDLARKIDAESRRYGGFIRYEDLASYDVSWVDPISFRYHGYDVCEIPPNGQGIVTLMALNILKEFDFTCLGEADRCHLGIEAVKMAFADAFRSVTDPLEMSYDYHLFLDPVYGASRAAEIGDSAGIYTDIIPPSSGTVYLATADAEGNMVSYIQSNYRGFGSGIVVEGTGIALQNRGCDFSLDPGNINCLKPGKKTYHTIIPGFLMKEGEPVGPFGVMGGYMQPQGHLQVVMNYADLGLNPQQTLDAPRWQWMETDKVIVEPGFNPELVLRLKRLGHDIGIEADHVNFGRGQMIVRLPNGTLVGGTECRTDSNIACF